MTCLEKTINYKRIIRNEHLNECSIMTRYGEDWFTNSMARRALGEKEYDRVWSEICENAQKDGKGKSDAIHYADEMVRAEGYGFFRAGCYMLLQMPPSDDFIDKCRGQGQTEQQMQKGWKDTKLQMIDDLAETIGVTREQVIKMAEDMKSNIEEGLKNT